jgi:Subtilase family
MAMTLTTAKAEDGVDPYLFWTQTTGWQGHSAVMLSGPPGGRLDSSATVPVLIELKTATSDAVQLDIAKKGGLANVPGLYGDPAVKASRYCTATVKVKDLAALRAHPEVDRFEMALPLSAGPVDPAFPPPSTLQVGKAGEVVIGIIDRGCAFLNTAFRNGWVGPDAEQTRIAALWDQGVAASAPWHAPQGLGYGRELLAADINTLIGRVNAGAGEPELYRELDYLVDRSFVGYKPVVERVHGTHVMDTLAGLVPPTPIAASAKPADADHAQRCRIIAVNIPGLAKDDTTGASSGVFLLDAVRYILHRAGPGTRVVINISIGIHGGPHDGSSLIGLALHETLALLRSDLAIVVAAGNAAQERWSTTGTLTPGAVDQRVLRLMPNDPTDSFLELWWDAGAALPGPKPLKIKVEPPDGLPATDWITAGESCLCRTAAGRPAYSVTHLARSALGEGPMALVSLAPTSGDRAAALPGRWTVHLWNEGYVEVAFDAWVQRDEPPLGTDDPIQPSFDDFDAGREGEGCALSDLACGPLVIAVGAARAVDGQESGYSGRRRGGRRSARPGVRYDVDVLASADESDQVIGLFAAAVRSGQLFRMGGTSVAAPVVARKIANDWATPVARARGPQLPPITHPPGTTKAGAMVVVNALRANTGSAAPLPRVKP